MKNSKRYYLPFILALLFFGTILNGQNQDLQYEVKETKIIKLGKTSPISELISQPLLTKEKKAAYKLRKQKPDNFRGRGKSKVTNYALEHQGPDPVRQSEMGQNSSGELLVNVMGLGSGSPTDPSGDIGNNHYIQAVNGTQIGVYDKSGNLLNSFSANTLWAEFNVSGRGDPIILFDEMSERWFITEFTDPANELIAISETDDPLGSYTAYNFSTPSFPDYPKFGIWPNALVMTTNEGGPGTLHNYFFERDSLLAGADEVRMQRVAITGSNSTEAGFYVTTPLDFNGSTLPTDSLPVVMRMNDSSWGNVAEDQIELYAFDINWNDVDSTTFTTTEIVTAPFDGYPCSAEGFGFACVPQRGGGGLDAIPEVIMNVPQYRNFGTHESIVLSFVTDATDGENLSAIRWMELRRTPGTEYSVYQEGTYAPDDLDRYMSSIAIDANGNIGLAYNVSSENEYVGIRYTGRFANDPLGVMTLEETTVIDGQSSINSFGRFGDYAQMGVDPIDGSTFWFTTEYAGTNNTRTRIIAFQLQKNNLDAAPFSFISPTNGNPLTDSESVTVEYKNVGISDIEGMTIGLYYNNETIETFVVPDTLSENETYTHTFETKLDLSAFGEYKIGTFTSFPLDENIANDTLYTTISNSPSNDGQISSGGEIETCNENKNLELKIDNLGLDPITEVTIAVDLNGEALEQQSFVVNIPVEGSSLILFPLMSLVEGENQIEVSIVSVNGSIDPIEDNNITSSVVIFEPGADEYILLLTTDEYPQETSWVLTNSSGTVVGTGGSYTDQLTQFSDVFCLATDQCYTFSIFDTYNDGICCAYGKGGYSIIDPDGNTVVSGGQFGGSESVEICAGTPCVLEATVDVTDESGQGAADGAILIETTGGIDTILYSIDGGQTFQDSPLFENLGAGEYSIIVVSNQDDCETIVEATIGTFTSIIEIEGEFSINVSPNPSEGFYHVEVANYSNGTYNMKMQVIDANGRIIQTMPLQKYNNIYEGDISLLGYPSGIYYLKFVDDQITKMPRLIKL